MQRNSKRQKHKHKITNQLSTTTTGRQTDHDVDDVAEAWSRAKAFGFVGQTDRYGEADKQTERQGDRQIETELAAGGSLKTCHNSQANVMCES